MKFVLVFLLLASVVSAQQTVPFRNNIPVAPSGIRRPLSQPVDATAEGQKVGRRGGHRVVEPVGHGVPPRRRHADHGAV
jgi:hypothetical protein